MTEHLNSRSDDPWDFDPALAKPVRPRVVVHVGMHKSGSSTIQTALHQKLFAGRCAYFDLGWANHSIPMGAAFGGEASHFVRRLGYGPEKLGELRDSVLARLQTQLNDPSQPDTLILSGEDISMFPTPSLEKLRLFLGQFSRDVEIVGYVRPPMAYIQSDFQQKVKGGMGRFDIAAHYPNYRRRFEHFDKIFGSRHVHLWKFDPAVLVGGDVAKDFAHRLGLTLSVSPKRANESLSREVVSLLYISRHHAANGMGSVGSVQVEHRLMTALASCGSTKFRFFPKLLKGAALAEREDLAWMEGRLRCDLHEKMAPQATDIKAESDLLRVKVPVIQNLVKVLDAHGIEAPKGLNGVDHEKIAQAIDLLRMKLSSQKRSN
jgi:hypothetical protein